MPKLTIPFLRKKEEGQTLLIVVLVMVVTFTIALSIAARNATNLRVSTEEANSQQALSAAEAGVEKILKSTGVTTLSNQDLGNNISIKNVSVTQVSGTKFQLKGGNSLDKDNGTDVWLADHNPDGTLVNTPLGSTSVTFYWGDQAISDCSNAAVEIVVLYGASKNTASSQRYAFDTGCARGNGFQVASSAIGDANWPVGGPTYKYKATIPAISNGWLVRFVPLYSSTLAAVVSTNALPQQGKTVASIGQSGNAQKRIAAFQGYAQVVNEFFPYILFCTKSALDATSCK